MVKTQWPIRFNRQCNTATSQISLSVKTIVLFLVNGLNPGVSVVRVV